MKNHLNYRLILLCLYVFCVEVSNAQIKTSVSYSNPWVEKIKEVKKIQKEYKHAAKEKLGSAEEYHAARDDIEDSFSKISEHLDDIPIDDLVTISELTRSKSEYQSIVDSLLAEANDSGIDNETSIQFYNEKIDSCQTLINAYSNSYLGIESLNSEIRYDSITIPPLLIDSTLTHSTNRDSLLQNQLSNHLESYAKSLHEVDELKQQESTFIAEQKKLESYQKDFNKYREGKNLKSSLEKLSASDLVEKNKTIHKAHQQLEKNKRKYLTLPSSAHLKQGVKKTSLENLSFWERIKLGGNLRVSQISKSLDIDFSPSIAFMINKKLSTGTEFVIRSQFREDKRWYKSFGSDTYGGRLFADYFVINSFFAHAEYEQIFKPTIPQLETPNRQMVPGVLAGIGRTFDLGKKVKGKIIVQYNFIYDETRAVYPGPWVVRFGLEINNEMSSDKKVP